MTEILIYIGIGIGILLTANFFLEIGVSIVLSFVITAVTLLGFDFGLGWELVTGDIDFFDEPLFVASLVVSALALILVWFLEGLNLIILMVVWGLFQLPAYEQISNNINIITSVFVEEKEKDE